MEEFLKQLIEELEERLSYTEDDYTIHQYTVCKTNDTVLHSVVIRLGDEQISKNIYVEPYFCMNMSGTEMDEIVDAIIKESRNRDEANEVIEAFADSLVYEEVKDKIILRVISKELNKEYLNDKVYVDIEDTDLVAVFYMFVSKYDNSLINTYVDKKLLEHWGIDSGNDIYDLAIQNTMRILPPTINSMNSIIDGCNLESVSDEVVEEVGNTMFVLTNDMSVNGATAMFYDGVLKQFAITHNTDKVVIMPSSRHEVILLPHYEEVNYKSSYRMVEEVNQYVVGKMDILSNSVYIYDLDTDSIRIWKEG